MLVHSALLPQGLRRHSFTSKHETCYRRTFHRDGQLSLLTSTLLVWVALEALSTLTPVGSSLIEAAGVEATGIVLALVQGPTVGVGITSGSCRE